MGAVCQCQHDGTRSVSTEVEQYPGEMFEQEARIYSATEKIETEEHHFYEEIDKIWEEYDKDGDGKLDKDEAYAFLKVTLQE